LTRNGDEVVLLLGGARSGKSRMAQARAEAAAQAALVYIATGEARDSEMAARIARHRQDRGDRWRTVEAPIELPDAIARERGAGRVVLVDCLTLWLSNLLLSDRDITNATEHLLRALREGAGTVLLVSNEVGLGIVPDNALARQFRDEAGRLHQNVAAVANEVLLVAAGLAIKMK
jgi:adenosylcobinamide kinase / adenosylcobinamide-phosphate guanylyltransferase